ncbi:hypothetical protein ATANTOWER_026751 [Ataeniobius toweri]|uniref:Uncharacterized protein n=1 Tax=Ataeniobius toweri TaxID=208326 RepID=A0ABU7CDG2_9TELE|nr:hypothetical protein [Ataeniobius toweri]
MPCLSKPVQVETITTGETCGADVALMNQVKRKVKLEGTNQDGQCLIVFCPITSRVGSDVEAAMQNIPSNKRIILVLMHHTRDGDYSTAGKSWSEDYPDIKLEVHVLYHESMQGLLTCSKNTEAVYKMQEYFQQNGMNPRLRNVLLLVLAILAVVLFLVLLSYFELKMRSTNSTN